MNVPSISPRGKRAVTEWKPQDAQRYDAEAEAVKEYARAVKNWDMLAEAVDQQIEDQRRLVEWWRENVSVREKNRKLSPDQGAVSLAAAEAESGIRNQKVSKWRKRLGGDLDEYRQLLRGPSYRKAMLERGSSDQRGASGTGENEWFTPADLIERARLIHGVIDLDPATHKKAQEVVRAVNYFTKKDNGLTQEWHGRVWLNPPYAQPLIGQFVDKLIEEYVAGRVTAAIMLTHNYTDTGWFQKAAAHASALCFTRGRVKFYELNGSTAQPTQGQAFHYFGDDVDAFHREFGSVGFVARLMRG